MIDWLMRRLLPGRYRKDEADELIQNRRDRAQVSKLEAHLMQTAREQRERQDIADALAQSPPPFRLWEDRR